MLIPSQAISSGSINNNTVPRNRSRARSLGRNTNDNSNRTANGPPRVSPDVHDSAAALSAPQKKKNRRRNKKKQETSMVNEVADSQASKKDDSPVQGEQKGGVGRNRKAKTSKASRFPWRRFLNNSLVDPITLEPLNILAYPPFALCADSPYLPVPEWPVPEEIAKPKPLTETVEERQKRILQEQWGSAPINMDEIESPSILQPPPLSKRKLNLFDGRALAYYMVSQLQFIDPLNRRDLTRDELVNLDRYLRRSGFNDLNVTEAYDARGISLSSAGASASTDEGRALIRQQEIQRLAQSLLNSVFAGSSVTSRPAQTTDNTLQAQYAASQRQDQQRRQQNRPNRQRDIPEDRGIYGSEETGLVIIDDDANPGLRGGGAPSQTTRADAPAFTPGNLWSGSRYVSHAESVQASNFPALAPASAPAAARPARPEAVASVKKPHSRSLSRITKVVAKTSEKELQKQREARELFIKRAAMSTQVFGVERSNAQAPSGLLMPPSSSAGVEGPTQGLLLRNQVFASALGIVPATVRQQSFNEGWSRPTDSTVPLDEFGNELISANYSDSLIIQARERMPALLKLEKKWNDFLADDTAASLPLNKMDRPLRTFVHAYSDFWALHTESFDPEPDRYIHCVKLRDTRAPRPLLSVAARSWRGPKPLVVDLTDHALKQTAGQTPREFPPPPPREPLQLKARGENPAPPRGAPFQADTESDSQLNSRSDELFSGRSRPKLELAPRTLPVELPRMEKGYNLVEERERQKALQEGKRQLELEEEERNRRILASLYASDDDEKSIKSHDSDEWDDLEAEDIYSGSDDEN